MQSRPHPYHSGAWVRVRVDGYGYPYPRVGFGYPMDFIYGYGSGTVLILENPSGTGWVRVRGKEVWVFIPEVIQMYVFAVISQNMKVKSVKGKSKVWDLFGVV